MPYHNREKGFCSNNKLCEKSDSIKMPKQQVFITSGEPANSDDSNVIDKSIEKHKAFLDFILTKYLTDKWTLEIPEKEIDTIIKDFGIVKSPTINFYRSIVKFAPLLISDDTSKSKAAVARKIGFEPDYPLIKYVLPYLNPRFGGKKKEKLLSEKTIKERARKMNLELLSDYAKEYKTQKSILRWLCLKCKHKFSESFYNLQKYIIPCVKCREGVKDARGVIHHKIPEYLKNRVGELVRDEVDKFISIRKYQPVSFPELQKKLLQEFPKEVISAASIREIAIGSAKILDFETGEIKDYYDLMWGKIHKKTFDDAIESARVTGLIVNNVPGSLVTSRAEFKILTENISPTRVVLIWSCNIQGHEDFPARFDSIIDGQWCPKCFAERMGQQSYNDFVELAKRRGVEENNVPGTLVTTPAEFEEIIALKHTPPSKAILTWICNTKRHKSWDAIPNSISQGTWCPYCSEGKYESIYRENIESIFRNPFSKTRMHTLGSVPDKILHFDCYAELPVINDELILGRYSVNLNLNNGLLMLLNANEHNLIYHHHQRVYQINSRNDRQRVLENITHDFLSKRILAHEVDTVLIEFPYGFIEFEFVDNLVTLRSKVLKEVKCSLNLSSGKLKTASEYNGPQHYYFPNPFHRLYNDFSKNFASFMRFLTGRCNDILRKDFSDKNDIILIEFPFWINFRMNRPPVIQDYIIKEFQSKTGIDLTYSFEKFI